MTWTQPTVSLALPGNFREKGIQVFPLSLGQRDIGMGHRLLDSNKRLVVELSQMRSHQGPGRGENLKRQHCLQFLISAHPGLLGPKERKDWRARDLGKPPTVAGFDNKMNSQSYALSVCFHLFR